jgi:DNA-binding MarR family transcriptional regulator
MEASRRVRPAESLAFLLSELGWSQARLFRESLEPFGVDPREFAVLRALSAAEGPSQRAVSTALGITPSRMVAVVDSLEAKGLVERRQNAQDRRARAVYLTEAGSRTYAGVLDRVTKVEQWLSGPLQDSERQALLGLLHRVADHVGLTGEVHPAVDSPWPWLEP